MLLITLVLVLFVPILGFLGTLVSLSLLALFWILLAVWFVFARDPTARVPAGTNLVVAPAHGKVDVIDTINEPLFLGGECQRVSMFLSVLDVHVQNAPVGGRIGLVKYTEGQFLNAMRTESAACNENVFIGIDAAEPSGAKVALRLIAGVLARRIVPWVGQGDEVARGDRIGLIQFGSRVDLYLPHPAKIKIQPGDRVVGGETVMAVFE